MNDQDAAFIERMAAEATHEIMNGLASIGQASGLMGDLLALGFGGGGVKGFFKLRGKSGGVDTTARFKKSITAVQNSVQRSLETTNALNRFMHDLNPSQEPRSAKDIVSIMAALMRRSAKQRKVELLIGTIAPEYAVTIPLLPLYRGLSACIDELLGNAEPGMVLSLQCTKGPRGLVFSVQSVVARPAGELEGTLQNVSSALSEIGCELYEIEDGYGIIVPLPAA